MGKLLAVVKSVVSKVTTLPSIGDMLHVADIYPEVFYAALCIGFVAGTLFGLVL